MKYRTLWNKEELFSIDEKPTRRALGNHRAHLVGFSSIEDNILLVYCIKRVSGLRSWKRKSRETLFLSVN